MLQGRRCIGECTSIRIDMFRQTQNRRPKIDAFDLFNAKSVLQVDQGDVWDRGEWREQSQRDTAVNVGVVPGIALPIDANANGLGLLIQPSLPIGNQLGGDGQVALIRLKESLGMEGETSTIVKP